MIINILVCKPNGEQVIENKEVPDTWFPPAEGDENADKSVTEEK
ncbi:MAG: hypothetical protein ACOX7O_07785 [Oscillospiraceae bacterium]|jgi:hypothetical protein